MNIDAEPNGTRNEIAQSLEIILNALKHGPVKLIAVFAGILKRLAELSSKYERLELEHSKCTNIQFGNLVKKDAPSSTDKNKFNLNNEERKINDVALTAEKGNACQEKGKTFKPDLQQQIFINESTDTCKTPERCLERIPRCSNDLRSRPLQSCKQNSSIQKHEPPLDPNSCCGSKMKKNDRDRTSQNHFCRTDSEMKIQYTSGTCVIEKESVPHPLFDCFCDICQKLILHPCTSILKLETRGCPLLPPNCIVKLKGSLVGTVAYVGHERRFNGFVTERFFTISRRLGVTVYMWELGGKEKFVSLNDIEYVFTINAQPPTSKQESLFSPDPLSVGQETARRSSFKPQPDVRKSCCRIQGQSLSPSRICGRNANDCATDCCSHLNRKNGAHSREWNGVSYLEENSKHQQPYLTSDFYDNCPVHRIEQGFAQSGCRCCEQRGCGPRMEGPRSSQDSRQPHQRGDSSCRCCHSASMDRRCSDSCDSAFSLTRSGELISRLKPDFGPNFSHQGNLNHFDCYRGSSTCFERHSQPPRSFSNSSCQNYFRRSSSPGFIKYSSSYPPHDLILP